MSTFYRIPYPCAKETISKCSKYLAQLKMQKEWTPIERETLDLYLSLKSAKTEYDVTCCSASRISGQFQHILRTYCKNRSCLCFDLKKTPLLLMNLCKFTCSFDNLVKPCVIFNYEMSYCSDCEVQNNCTLDDCFNDVADGYEIQNDD